jgi:hypothetical protein
VDIFTIKSGDLQPPLEPTLLDGGEPVNLSTATNVQLKMRASQGGPLILDTPMTVVGDPADGVVRYQWLAGDTDTVGKFYTEYVVTWPGGPQTFPLEDYCLVVVEPSLDATSSLMPDLPDSCWPVDGSACEELDNYSATTRAMAESFAGQTLRMLTGFRVGGCPITVRPCSISCAASYGGFGPGWNPHISVSGAWVNGCCAATDCGHLGTAKVILPGPVGEVTEVLIDGVALDAALYRVDNGDELVRLDGEPWPTTQDMLVGPDEVGSFAVTYLKGVPVDGLGAYAAGVLACEFGRALSGANCRLPVSVTSITRQGVSMTLEVGAFPGGVTGIREVDSYIERWNPGHLRSATKIWSPDLVNPRTTTWVSP